MAMYLVDTNVMLAASAIHELSLVAARAMPREIELREVVYEWLYQFDLSPDHLVLDEEGLVPILEVDDVVLHGPQSSLLYSAHASSSDAS